MSSIETVTIDPTTAHTHTVIFLHGRGDVATNFARSLHYSITSNGKSLLQSFPSFRWVFPEAGSRPCLAAPGQPRMSQWFDIWNVRSFSDREELQAQGLRESVNAIRHLLASEAAALGGRWDHIFLAGISQGAATSVHTLINLNLDLLPNGGIVMGERNLGAFLGFSCRMPFPHRTLEETRQILNLEDVPNGNELLSNTPVLLEHCTDDPLVLVENGRVLCETLRNFGAHVVWREYPTGGALV